MKPRLSILPKPLLACSRLLCLVCLLAACGTAPRAASPDPDRLPPPGVYPFSIEVTGMSQLRDRQERIRESVSGRVSISPEGDILVDTSHGSCSGAFRGGRGPSGLRCHGIRASVSGSAEAGVSGSVSIQLQERRVVRGPCIQYADEARTRCTAWDWEESYRTVWRGGSFRSPPPR